MVMVMVMLLKMMLMRILAMLMLEQNCTFVSMHNQLLSRIHNLKIKLCFMMMMIVVSLYNRLICM